MNNFMILYVHAPFYNTQAFYANAQSRSDRQTPLEEANMWYTRDDELSCWFDTLALASKQMGNLIIPVSAIFSSLATTLLDKR